MEFRETWPRQERAGARQERAGAHQERAGAQQERAGARWGQVSRNSMRLLEVS